MKRYLLKTTFGAVLIFLAAVTTQGCSKIYINIGEGETTNTNPNNTDNDKSLVTFHASVEGRMMTRSISSIGKDIQVQLFAFNGTEADATGMPINNGLYTTPTPGLLTGVSGYKMYLTNGIYNFYGVSENTSFSRLRFTNGKSDELSNGIDYLWWSGMQQDVNSSQISIPIVFTHSATQVVFEVEAGEGVTINQLVMAHISASKLGARLDLSTGIITPSTEYETGPMDKMGINGLLAQYIMLPLQTTTPMKVSFDVVINGETTARNYQTTLEIPNGELLAGNSYRFKAIIKANTVEFPSVSVTDWVSVDETGKPLYPVQ